MRRSNSYSKGAARLAGSLCVLVSLIAGSSSGGTSSSAQYFLSFRPYTTAAVPATAASPRAALATSAPPLAGASPGYRAPHSFFLDALLRNGPLIAAGAGILVLIVDRLVLWKWPRLMLRLPDEGVQIPWPWDPSKRLALGPGFIRSLKYRNRVLDAWVEAHQCQIAQRFSAIASVEQRRHYLSLPVLMGQKLVTELTPELLRQMNGLSGLVLISGEGGVGKTSLALRIAIWALEGRLTDRAVVPVLVEADLQKEESLLSRVRSFLETLTQRNGQEVNGLALTLPLVRALLERRRLLVILDRFSELGDESRQRLLSTADGFPSAMAIVTSRREENFTGKVVMHLRPQRLTADRLWPFFTDYLRLVQAEEAFDFDLHERAVGRLREITGGIVDEQQAITVLLAKLYIDVVLAERRGDGGWLLPASVPALMLTYVRQINDAIPEADRQPSELVVRALELLAQTQASEEKKFRPQWAQRTAAQRALARACAEWGGKEDEEESRLPRGGVELLQYLVERLLLVERIRDGESVRLVLDPLTDYLAALGWLRQLDREGDGAWDRFLGQTLPAPGSDESAEAQGFLRALYDCAVHASDPAVLGLQIELQVVGRLAERAAIDPQRIALDRERRRLRRLIDDLAEPDVAVRVQAIEELCRRRSSEAIVTTALKRVLKSEQQDQNVREAAAIALAAQGGEDAARALAELVESQIADGANPASDAALRCTVLESLGLVLAGLREDSQAPAKGALRQLLKRQLYADELDLLVEGDEGWAEHDKRLPLLQGASKGLILAASAELPLLGSGPGIKVPMLSITALHERKGLRIRTEVVKPAVWKLPLPDGEQLELVVVKGGKSSIGSPDAEEGRDWYATRRDGCNEGINVEAERIIQLKHFAIARHAITQSQWRVVAELDEVENKISSTPWSFKEPKGLWERYAQPWQLPADSISWNDSQEWLRRLNRWLRTEWNNLGGVGESPKLALPSESQWETACRAGSTTPFHFGETLDRAWANYYGKSKYGLGREGPDSSRPVSVEFFGLVNRWGLAEMHGQIYEWCGDQWHPDPVGEGWPSDGQPWEEVDPVLEATGSAQKSRRVLRGGSWIIDPHSCRAAFRNCFLPAVISSGIGMRPCCPFPPDSLLDP